jgi:hypothetical protein
MHLLDSGSSLFLTPFKDALILGIKTVMNIGGVGGDVAKIKLPLVYTFLDSKGEYVGFHYQSLYVRELTNTIVCNRTSGAADVVVLAKPQLAL